MVGRPRPMSRWKRNPSSPSFLYDLRMLSIIGKKIRMSQVFAPDGTVIPVTIVQAGPCVVTQVKTVEHDGVNAIEMGFGFSKRLSKAQQGHLKGLGSFRVLKSVRLRAEEIGSFERGATIDVTQFQKGQEVTVVGTSKGKGFQGVVKRHHFHGSPKTHGHKDQLRMPGSSGAGGMQHVRKGKRMAGRMGDARITVKNLSILEIDPTSNELWVKGAVPGARGGLLLITVNA